jgi:hypothetical protein
MFQNLGNLRHGNSKSGLSRLEVPFNGTDNPKTCKKWCTLDLPSDIEDYIIERNQEHFGQAAGPWTESPLYEEVDFAANTVTMELILKGEYDASQLSSITQLMLKNLKHCDAPQETLPLFITDEELVSKLANWKEKTTTSPSFLHLGHCTALVQSRQNFTGVY